MKSFLKAFFSPQIPENIGKLHLEWNFSEFKQEKRSRKWVIAFVVIVGLLLVYSVVTSNLLFGVILVIVAFVIIFQSFQTPRSIPIMLGEDGIILDKKFYPYKALQSFWIAYDPPMVKYLYLDFKNKMKKSLPIPLENMNPLEIREVLLDYIEEDLEKEGEGLDETVARLFKLR